MTGTISKLQPYSYGIIAENKALNSFEVEVTPIEDLTMLDGEVTAQVSSQSASGTDAKGAAYTSQTKQTATVRATWLPIGSGNRQTPPDVRRGEQVMLYRYSDADKYYWVTLRSDLSLRRLETFIFAISAAPGASDTVDRNSTYVLGMSSHQKRIWLLTSQANGEPYRYQLELDLAKGVFSLWDNIDNAVFLSSADHHIRMQNADGSFLELTKNILNGQTADQMNWKTSKWKVDADTIEENASSSITETSPQRTFEGSQDSVNANQTVAGNWNTTPGKNGANGDATSSGNFTTTGTMEAEAGMKTTTLDAQTVHADTYENLPG